jgi:hypothetical protein
MIKIIVSYRRSDSAAIAGRIYASDGRSRIQDEADPVRFEIETALRQGLTVIPVLVDDTLRRLQRAAGSHAASSVPPCR